MDKKELKHRVERSQQELEFWRGRADMMRQVLDRLETDYLTHRTDCCLVRPGRLRAVVVRVLDTVAILEGGLGEVPEVGAESTAAAGRSSPTETDSLLTSSQPPSSTTGTAAADFSRNIQRLANRSNLKSMTQAELESELSRTEARARHQRDDYNAIRGRLATLANDYDELQQQTCCLCFPCGCGRRLEEMIRTALDRPGRLVNV